MATERSEGGSTPEETGPGMILWVSMSHGVDKAGSIDRASFHEVCITRARSGGATQWEFPPAGVVTSVPVGLGSVHRGAPSPPRVGGIDGWLFVL